MYTIKRAAELTGVGVATLRAWERRYGVLAPQRSSGRYRLYDEASLERIRAMQALIDSGWAARQAAAEVQRGWRPAPDPADGSLRRASPAGISRGPTSGGGPAGGATALTPAAAEALAQDERFEGFRRAAVDFDSVALADLLDEWFRSGAFENVVDDWLMPALVVTGADWEAGRLSVAGEHFVANAVQRRLATAYEIAYRETTGPRVIAGLPPGSAHDLGLFAFTVAARRAGLATTYLGANVPVADWLVAAARDPTAFVVLAAPRRRDVTALSAVVEALRAAYPGIGIGVGGRYQHLAPAASEQLGHRIGPAADRLARELGRLAAAQPAGDADWWDLASPRPSRGQPR